MSGDAGMNEFLPVVEGIAIALLISTLNFRSPVLKIMTALLLCLLGGFIASWVSGELYSSWLYLLLDALIVAISLACTLEALRLRQRIVS
jgi:hypothetical protein